MTSPSEHEGVQATPNAASAHVTPGPADAPEAAHDHGHAADEGPHFTEHEWEEFQKDDVHAGGAVVCLMAAIFFIGLMLYSTIALIVAA